jgi:hypothetical protein
VSPPSLLFAAAALLPAMTAPSEGAPQLSAASALIVALCNGGTMALSLAGGAPPPATAPCCCAKGCRTGKRKRIDREQ